MTVEELRTLVAKVIAEQLGIKAEEVKPTCKLIDDLKVDALDYIEVVMALEETLGISIPDEEMDKLITVEDLTAYANSKLPKDDTPAEPKVKVEPKVEPKEVKKEEPKVEPPVENESGDEK